MVERARPMRYCPAKSSWPTYHVTFSLCPSSESKWGIVADWLTFVSWLVLESLIGSGLPDRYIWHWAAFLWSVMGLGSVNNVRNQPENLRIAIYCFIMALLACEQSLYFMLRRPDEGNSQVPLRISLHILFWLETRKKLQHAFEESLKVLIKSKFWVWVDSMIKFRENTFSSLIRVNCLLQLCLYVSNSFMISTMTDWFHVYRTEFVIFYF